jgi:prepilin-type N-terminal cleavage/methylation domain-containing protein
MKPTRDTRRRSQSVAADARPRQLHESAPTDAGGYAALKAARQRGFTLTELLVVLVLIVVLAAVLLPWLSRPRRSPSSTHCMINLKQIGTAFRLWASDHSDKFPMSVSATNEGTLELGVAGAVYPHFQVMSNELITPKILVCREDARSIATNFTTDFADSRISYFVGVDTAPANPRGLLTGDRNLTLNGQTGLGGLVALATNAPASWVTTNLHKTLGVVGFADGSVQRVTTAQLRQALAASGTTNRLAIP